MRRCLEILDVLNVCLTLYAEMVSKIDQEIIACKKAEVNYLIETFEQEENEEGEECWERDQIYWEKGQIYWPKNP